MRSEKKEITSARGRGGRRSTTNSASRPTPASERAGRRSTEGVVSEEGKTEPMEGGERESSGVSRVCFDGVFAELQHFKEENGSLTISVSHPSFLSILDLLSAVGMGELLTKRFYAQIDSLKQFSKEEERKDDSIADRASKNEEKPTGVSLTLDEKIRMKTEAKKAKSRSRRKRATGTSSLKILPDKESVAAELQKKNARGTAHRSAAAVHRSLILKEMFCPSDIIVTTKDDNEGSELTSGSSSDDDSLGSLKTFHIAPTADDIGLESWSNLDATLSSAKVPTGNHRNSAGKCKTTIRKKMEKEHRSSSMPASSTNDAAKDDNKGGKSNDGTLKKKPHRRCTFEDRLRRKANGESLEDIYEDWQRGEEARPIRHDSFALDDVVGSSSDWRSKMNPCGWQSKDDIGLESWSNLGATLSSPPAKAPQENRRNSAGKCEKTIRKKMGKEHRSSSMPTSFTSVATKDDDEGGKSTVGTLKKKPHRRCTFEDRLRRKANGESLEDIYEDWQGGEEARPIRHDSFALDDVVGSSSDWRSKMNACGWRSKDDIGLESWSNLDATPSSGRESPPAKAPQEHRRNSAGKYEKTIRKKMGKKHRSSSMPTSWTNDATKDDEGRKSTDGTLKKKPRQRCTFEDRLRRKANGESLEDIYEDWQGGEEARPIRHDSFGSNLDATLSSGKTPPAKLPQENRRNSASKYEETIRKKMGKEHRSSSMPTSSTNGAAKGDNKGGKSTDGTLKKKPHRRCTFEDRLRRKANGESLEGIYEDWQSGEEARPIRHDSFALDDIIDSSSDDDSLGSLDGFQNAPMVAGWRSKMNACGWQSKDDIGLESWSNLDATLAYSMKLSLGNHL